MVTGITNGRIRDLASFDQVTGSPRQVAGVYFYALLDPLIELAHEIARDFFSLVRGGMGVDAGAGKPCLAGTYI